MPDDKARSEALEEAARVLRLVAEPTRLRVVAALVLGKPTPAEIAEATDLDARAVGRALVRLEEEGLVVAQDGVYEIVRDELQAVARAAVPADVDEHPDAPESTARVLRAFLKKGRLVSIPVARAKRLVVLDFLAQEFEPGVHYAERDVNEILGRYHDDVASLRRVLVDDGFLERDSGEYWRSGGEVAL